MPAPSSRGVILIADDDELVRGGIEALLQREGYATTGVASGEAMLAALQTAEYDALISDIYMPGNVRLEAVEVIRRVAPALPVILLTGRPSIETAVRSVRLPVTAYLTKPPAMTELIQLLDAAIADYRTYRALQAGRARLHDWARELEVIERDLRAAPPGGAAGQGVTMSGFFKTSLRQVISVLADLERTAGSLGGSGVLKVAEQEAALRHTVDVLERTKQSFKSKELAELRRQLEELLKKTGREG